MRHVVFDFDGTLVDSRQIGMDIYNEIATQKGFKPLSDAVVDELRQLPMMTRFDAMGVPLRQLPGLVLVFTKRYRQALDRLQFFPGIPEVLTTLHQRDCPVHILSSNSEENIRTFLAAQGVTSVRSVTSARSVFGKDRAIAKFLRRQGLQAKDILYVGDEERDVIACKQVQVRVVGVTWGLDTETALQAAGADAIVHRPQDLPELVGRLLV